MIPNKIYAYQAPNVKLIHASDAPIYPDNIPFIRKDSLWKPTEEQMNALNTTYTYLFNQTNGVFPCLHTLETLYGDLKKLKAL